jgi:hypothetical protein
MTQIIAAPATPVSGGMTRGADKPATATPIRMRQVSGQKSMKKNT